jgi:hypothetical protein
MQNLETLARTQDWDYARTGKYSLHEEVYTREKLLHTGKTDVPAHIRRSLIERVDLPDLQKYYSGLTAIFGPAFNPPVAHITLFTWSDFTPFAHRGISISSEEEYRATLVEEL